MRVVPYGERGSWVEGGDFGALREAFPHADVVAGAAGVAVFGATIDAVPEGSTALPTGRLHRIDVAYDGPDLGEVAETLGMSRADVVDLHAGREYVARIVGFLPGFAYLGPVDGRLVVPRRGAPRPRVPARSVAIAAGYTAIYPLASPGGWSLLGRALGPAPFDPRRDPPALLAPGDRVVFRAVDGGEVVESMVASPSAGQGLVVARPGIATIQDLGRPGYVGRGFPASGALDPALLAAANRAVGNGAGAAAIELLGGILELEGHATLSVDGGPPEKVRGTVRITEGPRAVRYIAVAGGVGVPQVLGSRSTLLVAGLGGLHGRLLRRGDVVPVGDGDADGDVLEAGEILVDPGPHADRLPGALDALVGTAWSVSRLTDRAGMRLDGPPIPRDGPDLGGPMPMCRGAIQVTSDGTPIVLGPDHPTTGGYPVVAVVRAAGWGTLARKRTGEAVRLRLAP